jgi:hypothetical protein
MVVIFGEDANYVDDEVYRLRNCGEAVKGVCTLFGLRSILREYKTHSITVRLIPAHHDRDERDILLYTLGEKPVDAMFANMGS